MSSLRNYAINIMPQIFLRVFHRGKPQEENKVQSCPLRRIKVKAHTFSVLQTPTDLTTETKTLDLWCDMD